MWLSDSKTIVVLGATGFIGKYLCKEACSRGYQVIAVGRKTNVPHEFEHQNRLKYLSSSYEIESIRAVIAGADVVVNLAAIRSRSFSLDDCKNNINLTANCFEACRLEKIDKVIYMSSRLVYGEKDSGTEDVMANPISLYGESKLIADCLSSFYNDKYKMNIISLRCAQVLGWGEREGYVLNTFLNRAARKESLELWGNGVSVRRYIYVKDVVDAVLHALNTECSGIFNIGMPETISLSELAETINRVFENEGNIKYIPYENEDTAIDYMSVEKAKNVLRWQPKFDLTSALQDMRKDYEEGQKND